jgi:hypothetical protein
MWRILTRTGSAGPVVGRAAGVGPNSPTEQALAVPALVACGLGAQVDRCVAVSTDRRQIGQVLMDMPRASHRLSGGDADDRHAVRW